MFDNITSSLQNHKITFKKYKINIVFYGLSCLVILFVGSLRLSNVISE
jgi:hypothetical protein